MFIQFKMFKDVLINLQFFMHKLLFFSQLYTTIGLLIIFRNWSIIAYRHKKSEHLRVKFLQFIFKYIQ